jgi:hypothetical protein
VSNERAKGDGAWAARRVRLLLLLVILGTLIASVFGSAFERSILAETVFGQTQVQAVAVGSVPPVDASVPKSGARAKVDSTIAFGLAQAEPLLLLLLGSMLFCVAAGISVWVSRVEPD